MVFGKGKDGQSIFSRKTEGQNAWLQQYNSKLDVSSRPHVIILAAGDGSHMNSELPQVSFDLHASSATPLIDPFTAFPTVLQVLHPVAGLPMVCHVLAATLEISHSGVTVVVSPRSEAAIQQVIL